MTLYGVCESYYLPALMNEVNNLMLQGWVCQGGIASSFNMGTGKIHYLQAMVKISG